MYVLYLARNKLVATGLEPGAHRLRLTQSWLRDREVTLTPLATATYAEKDLQHGGQIIAKMSQVC